MSNDEQQSVDGNPISGCRSSSHADHRHVQEGGAVNGCGFMGKDASFLEFSSFFWLAEFWLAVNVSAEYAKNSSMLDAEPARI